MSEGTDQIPAQRFAGTATDDEGNVILSTDTEGEGGFGPRLSRFITAGFYNGDFQTPPLAADSEITPENPLPDWPLTRVSGTSIHAYSVTDAASASGRVIKFAMEAGAAGDDVYLEQIAEVNGARGQSWVYAPTATFLTGPTVSNAQMYTTSQYLKSDRTTATGAASTGIATTTATGANTLVDLQSVPAGGAIPSDALYLQTRLGFKRNTAATTTSETVTLTEVRMKWGGTQMILVESSDPASYGYTTMYQSAGALNISPNQGGAVGYTPRLSLANDGTIWLLPQNGSALQLLSGDAGQHPHVAMYERTDPGLAGANGAHIFVRDNGSGKTQLCVRFQSGAAIVIATEV